MKRELFSFMFIIIFLAPFSASSVADPLESLSHNPDDTNRYDPRDSDHSDDQSVFFAESEVATCSFFRVETKSYNVKLYTGDSENTDADLLIINFVLNSPDTGNTYYDVTINILMYGDVDTGEESTGVFVTNITKSFGTKKENDVLKVKGSDYGDNGLIPEGVQKFKVLITYRSVSGGSRHYASFFLWEDQFLTGVSQRWNIGYSGNARDTTFVDYFGDTSGYNDYSSDAATIKKADKIASLNASATIAAILGVIIAFVFIRAGSFLITMQSLGIQITGGILCYMGIMYLFATIGLIFDIPQVKAFFAMGEASESGSLVTKVMKTAVDPFGIVL